MQVKDVTSNQSSFMRPLVMDFSHDKKVWDLKYQYMFGKSILVAPVTEAQYTPEETEDNWLDEAAVDFTTKKESQVYLPAGSRWYDFWTNEIFNGGKEIVKETSIDIIPLYIKAGTILPVGPEVQYATEKNWDNLELRIYEVRMVSLPFTRMKTTTIIMRKVSILLLHSAGMMQIKNSL